jgi:RNA polymerase sigma factor (sigma-70 family)
MSEIHRPQTEEETDLAAERVRGAIDEFEVPLTRYAMSLLRDLARARDAVQDTFIKLYRQPVETMAEAKVKSWLFTVCCNRSLDILKKEICMISIDEEQIGKVRSAEPDPSEQSQASEDRAAIAEHLEEALKHMDGLPTNQREVLRLKFQGGMSYKEIAGALDLSVSNVGFLLHSGLTRLRKSLAVAKAN